MALLILDGIMLSIVLFLSRIQNFFALRNSSAVEVAVVSCDAIGDGFQLTYVHKSELLKEMYTRNNSAPLGETVKVKVLGNGLGVMDDVELKFICMLEILMSGFLAAILVAALILNV